jgi:hypothetical protein
MLNKQQWAPKPHEERKEKAFLGINDAFANDENKRKPSESIAERT